MLGWVGGSSSSLSLCRRGKRSPTNTYTFTASPSKQATAAECIRHLREQRVGVADFIPLQGIREKARGFVFVCVFDDQQEPNPQNKRQAPHPSIHPLTHSPPKQTNNRR